MHRRPSVATRLGLAAALLAWAAGGCARPYAGPKTLAAIGAGLALGGATTWALGERRGKDAWIVPGFVTTAVGIGVVIAAGGWMATSIACRADPDCPTGEQCKELPAPPGGIPYKQCVRR